MISNLKAVDYKGIKDVRLLDLGSINVICGKNNSGKSSILESLVEKGQIGIYFKDGQIFYERWIALFPLTNSSYVQVFSKLILDFFYTYFETTNNILFIEDIDIIASSLSQKLTSYPNDQYLRTDFGKIKDFISSFFVELKDTYKPILIPAKRHLEFENGISLNTTFEANGQGLLNHLFFLKNQDLSSTDFLLYQEIHKTFKIITGFDFNVVPTKGNNISIRFRVFDQWLNADQCGLGLRELLVMITYISSSNKTIIFLEEPENHLHADFQKKFMLFLREQKKKQFIIASHSNVFIDNIFVDKIFYCWFDIEVKLSDKTSASKIIDSLGYSIAENLTADAIILTEGPTDVPILKRILTLIGALDNYNIKFLPLGGDIMGSTDLSLFEGLDKVFAIIDSDPGSSKVRNTFVKNCSNNGIKCLKLGYYSIENYIPLDVIKAQFQEVPKDLKEINTTESVDMQIGFKEKAKSIKHKNHEMAAKMTLKDIEGTDLLKSLNSMKFFLDAKM